MPLPDFLDIECPIMQASLGNIQGSAVAIAVSSAGGASRPCDMLTMEPTRTELAVWARPLHGPLKTDGPRLSRAEVHLVKTGGVKPW